jgi:hypothetical protein
MEMSDDLLPTHSAADDETLVALRFLYADELGDDEALSHGDSSLNDSEHMSAAVRRSLSVALRKEAETRLLDRLALAVELDPDEALIPRAQVTVGGGDELLEGGVLAALKAAVIPETTVTLAEDVERWLAEATRELVTSRSSSVALAPKLLRVPWLCAHGWSDEVELAVEVDELAETADITVHLTTLDRDADAVEIGLIGFAKSSRVQFGVATLAGIPRRHGPLELHWQVIRNVSQDPS